MKLELVVCVIVALAFDAVLAEPAKHQSVGLKFTGVRARRSYDKWLDIISQYARRGGGSENLLQPFPVDLPVTGKDGRQSTLPLLVLPFPVPVRDQSGKQECSANTENDAGYDVRFGSSNFGQSRDTFEIQSSESVSSDYLIDVFKKQQPSAPELPPALIGFAPVITPPTIHRGYQPPGDRTYLPPAQDSTPPLPKFDRSMVLRGFLTVYDSDYTEAYMAWYDAKSGSARMELHEAGTTCWRSMMPNNRVKRATMYTDRTEETSKVVCAETSPSSSSAEDRQPPALPNTEGFTFTGRTEEYGVQAEVWKREVKGGPGELGAVRGESLTYRHELLIHRRNDGFSIPLRYTVAVDSSVLGPDCDGYQHLYSEVREKEHNDDEFQFPERQCDMRENLDPNDPEHMARLDPLREYTMMSRDPRYDSSFQKYTKEYERTYSDPKEEAMRKTLLIQHSRFISSCNRQSNTFTVGINFLSDRLDEEIQGILGVAFSAEFENNTINFPFSEEKLNTAQRRLPNRFDWREKGAVSPVKFQGVSCSSCWAFAVTGSVEGALFIKTKQLVELSVQSLVDCSRSHGAHGCDKIGTWPVHAYNYIKDKGIVADAEYAPYDAKDHKCKAPPSQPTTHIEGGVDVPPNNIEALKVSIRRFAPSVVVVDANTKTFIQYKKGVLRDDRCTKGPKKVLNHAVLAIGWGERKGEPHFILKNSWSAAWGDAGYIRVHAPSNTCGHLTTPSYARLVKSNIDKLPGGGSGSGATNSGPGAAPGGFGRSNDDDDGDDYDERR